MSPLPLKIKLPTQSLKQYLRVFPPNGSESADDWAATETGKIKIGDIYTIFQPAQLFSDADDTSELVIAGVALVFREDAGFPMNYFIDESSYEMSFMEGVLSSKAAEAKDEGLAFYCLHSSPANSLSNEALNAIGGMHKWGGAGDRHKAPQGLPDPLFFFLTSIGLATDPTTARDPLPIQEFVLALWNAAELPPVSRAPRSAAGFFTCMAGSGFTTTLAGNDSGSAKPAAPSIAAAASSTAPPSAAKAASNATSADGKLSELLEKMASVQFEDDDDDSLDGDVDDEEDSLDLASLENALKDLVAQQTVSDTPIPAAKPNAPVGRRTALGPQFEDSDGAWEMLKAKPKPNAPSEASPAVAHHTPILPGSKPGSPAMYASSGPASAEAPDGMDFSAALAADLNSEVKLGFAGVETSKKTSGMEPWPSDFAAALKEGLQEPAAAEKATNTTKGMEPWPSDFAAALKEGLSESAPPAVVQAASPSSMQAPATASATDDSLDFASALASELNSELNLSFDAESDAAEEALASSTAPPMGQTAPPEEKIPSDAISDLLQAGTERTAVSSLDSLLTAGKPLGNKPVDKSMAEKPAIGKAQVVKPALGKSAEAAQSKPESRLEAMIAKKALSQTASKLIVPSVPLRGQAAKSDAAATAGSSSKIPSVPLKGARVNPFADKTADIVAEESEVQAPSVAAVESAEAAAENLLPVEGIIAADDLSSITSGAGGAAEDAVESVETAAENPLPVEGIIAADDLSSITSGVESPSAEAAEAAAEDSLPIEGIVAADDLSSITSGLDATTEASTETITTEASAESEPIEATVEAEPFEATVEAEPIEASVEAEPIEASAESEPIEASIEAEPIESSTEAEPIEASVEDEPIEASVEAEPIEASVEAEPIEASVEAEPIEAIAEDEPIEASVEAEPIEASAEDEPIEASVEAEPIEAIAEDEPIEASVEAEPIEAIAEAEPIEASVEAESIEAIAEAEPIEASVETESIEAIAEAESNEVSAEAEPIEAIAAAEPTAVSAEAEATEQSATSVPEGFPTKPTLSAKDKLASSMGSRFKPGSAGIDAQSSTKQSPASKTGLVSGKLKKDPEHVELSDEQMAAASVEAQTELNEDLQPDPQPELPSKKLEPAPSPAVALSSDDEDDEETSASRPQKKLSLQATLAKIDDQTVKANQRLSEFKKLHEAACDTDRKSVKELSVGFAETVNQNMATAREGIVAKLHELFAEAKQHLETLVSEGQNLIAEGQPEAITSLEAIAGQNSASVIVAELQQAADKFIETCQSRLQSVGQAQEGVLAAVMDEELQRLSAWRSGQLKHFMESFEQILARVEQQRIASLSALESCVHSLSEELRRLQEFDLARQSLLNSELSENLEQACRLAEMRLNRHCDMALAEQILPLLAEWKSKLGMRERRLRLEVQEHLEGHSESSLADFEPVLSLGKEAVTLIVSNVGELKENIEKGEKAELEKKLLALSKHFDGKLEQLTMNLRQQKEKEFSGVASQEAQNIEKVDKIGETCLAQILENAAATETELSRQQESSVTAWESRAEDICAVAIAEMSADVEVVRNHRRESVRRLQEKLNKISSIVQALQAQLIQ